MVSLKPTFRGHLLQIAIAQLIGKIPADVEHNNIPLKAVPFGIKKHELSPGVICPMISLSWSNATKPEKAIRR